MQNLRQLPGSGVILWWDRPAANEWTWLFPVTQYRVELDGAIVGTVMADRDCSEREGCFYRAADLDSGSYTFLVWAENPEPGPASTIVAIIENVVPNEVRDLAGEQVTGDNAVRLTWKLPLRDSSEPDDSVIEYEVVGPAYGSTTVSASDCTGTGQAVSCSTVQSRLSYPDSHTFTVAAVNSAGRGPQSYVQVQVDDPGSAGPGSLGRAPGPVQNLSQLPGSAVILWWDRPAANESTWLFPVTQYRVELDGTIVGTVMANRDCSEREGCFYRDADLGPGSYTFSVWAENPEPGPASTITATVAAAVPAEVRELAGEQVDGDNAVLLTWKPPLASEQVDESVVEYEVFVDGSNYSTVEASACTGGRLNTLCSSLQSGLSYPDTHSFRLTAVNSAGNGAPSYVDVRVAETVSTPFTASFANAPASHNGRRRFNVDLTFSEDFRVSYRKLQNQTLHIEGGRIVRVRRKVRGSNRGWQVRIKPNRTAVVTLTLEGDRACHAPGALCTPDGRRLVGTARIAIPPR